MEIVLNCGRHILGVRNEINVLDLSQTLIQIRKALNLVFKIKRYFTIFSLLSGTGIQELYDYFGALVNAQSLTESSSPAPNGARDYNMFERAFKYAIIGVSIVCVIWIFYNGDETDKRLIEVAVQVIQYLRPVPAEIFNHIPELKELHLVNHIELSNARLVANISVLIKNLLFMDGVPEYQGYISSLFYMNTMRAIRDNPTLTVFSPEFIGRITSSVFRIYRNTPVSIA